MSDLSSVRFAGDSQLTLVLNGSLRLAAPGTPPNPAPILSSGAAVRMVQQALIDIGYPMPLFGADGNFGREAGQAVVAFKKDWHLVPGDPVVGPRTMAALDREMVAFERTAPPPPPPPTPPVPFDPFGRSVSGLAKVPVGLATAAALATSGVGGPWIHLDRATVAADIADRVNNPDGAQQGGNGLCTTAAFINVWAQDAPDAYAAFATALFENGAANIAPNQGGGGQHIVASNSLRSADYTGIITRMRQKGFGVPSQADWMTMSAIRDSTNTVVPFTGDPDNWVSSTIGDGASPFGDLDGWLRNAGAWVAVVEDANVMLTASLAEARRLDPARSRCLLNIDVGMLTDDSGRHTVVLRSPVSLGSDGFVSLKVWSWAGVRDVRIPTTRFENTYFGANVAFL